MEWRNWSSNYGKEKLNKIQRSTNKLKKKGQSTEEEFEIDWVNYINAKKNQESRLDELAIAKETKVNL